MSGSLRAGSFNTSLAHNAARLAPEGVAVSVATLHGIPLYNADEERDSGIPSPVLTLKDKVISHDGLLLLTPEYNSGIPGVMKNGLDWLSRAGIKETFAGRPVAVMGATPGGWGTLAAQNAWLPTLRTLGMTLYSGHRMALSRAGDALDDSGRLVNPETEGLLTRYMEGFARFIGKGS